MSKTNSLPFSADYNIYTVVRSLNVDKCKETLKLSTAEGYLACLVKKPSEVNISDCMNVCIYKRITGDEII